MQITSPAHVYIQLRCPSKDTTSAPRPFQYIPLLTSGTCKRKWNLVSFSGAYGSYLTNSQQGSSGVLSSPGHTSKKQKQVDLEDILADGAARGDGVGLPPDALVLPFEPTQPIYDRLNEFMSGGGGGGGGGGGAPEPGAPQPVDEQRTVGAPTAPTNNVVMSSENIENVYDVDLELISQIIRGQQDAGAPVGVLGGPGIVEHDDETILADAIVDLVAAASGAELDVFNDLVVMDVDAINGNGGEVTVPMLNQHGFKTEAVHNTTNRSIVPEQSVGSNSDAVTLATAPPTRPPKSQKAPPPPPPGLDAQAVSPQQPQPAPAPPLPPKKTSPKQSPTKQSPATFLKNLLFSPTKKNKNKAAAATNAPAPPPTVPNNNANNNVNTANPAFTTATDPLLSSTAAPLPPAQPLHQTNPIVLMDPTGGCGNYEFTENMALYVDNDAPLATASEFGDDDVVLLTTGSGVKQEDDSSQFYYCSVNRNNNSVNNN